MLPSNSSLVLLAISVRLSPSLIPDRTFYTRPLSEFFCASLSRVRLPGLLVALPEVGSEVLPHS